MLKEKMEFYPHYKKLMETKLDQSIVKTTEYQIFTEHYPHLTESIRLKREMERLTRKLKSEKNRSVRFQIKREMNVIKARLKRKNILKRLRGESKQETKFHFHFLVDCVRARVMKGYMTLRNALSHVQKKLQRSMYRNLPPSVFDLKSLDTAEKGLVLREWVQDRRKKRR